MPTRCPNCDAPLREGAKFCSSCGYQLEKVEPAVSKGTPAPAPAATSTPKAQRPQNDQVGTAREDTSTISCPHCGKLNRIGVKFCRFCGGTITRTKEKKPRSRARIVTIVFLVLVILMICISLIGIAWGLGIDRWLFPDASLSPFPVHGLIVWIMEAQSDSFC